MTSLGSRASSWCVVVLRVCLAYSSREATARRRFSSESMDESASLVMNEMNGHFDERNREHTSPRPSTFGSASPLRSSPSPSSHCCAHCTRCPPMSSSSSSSYAVRPELLLRRISCSMSTSCMLHSSAASGSISTGDPRRENLLERLHVVVREVPGLRELDVEVDEELTLVEGLLVSGHALVVDSLERAGLDDVSSLVEMTSWRLSR